jgi:hypothetical protein
MASVTLQNAFEQECRRSFRQTVVLIFKSLDDGFI